MRAVARIANKTVLITGASSGIGAATAREFAAAAKGNIKLVLAARRESRLSELATTLHQNFKGIKVHTSKLDVADPGAINSFLSTLPKEFQDIDVLVNSAGKALGRDPVGQIDPADLNGMIQTNMVGLINMTQAVLPDFKKKNSGDIINVGSVAGREPYPGGSVYCASKAAVNFFTDSLRKELINTRIRVIEIQPGMVETEFSLVRFHGDKQMADDVYNGGKPLVAEDVAELIVFAASRRENTVIAETLIFPSHQAGSSHLHKK